MSIAATASPRMPMFTKDWVRKFAENGLTVDVGEYTYGRPEILFRPADQARHSLRIGNFCSIAKNVTIHVGSYGRHTIDFVSSYPMTMVFGHPPTSEKSIYEQGNLNVVIGSDVWIGERATILPGATIGHGAVVGAGSFVTESLAPYTINVGCPARTIKKRFSDASIARFLALEWWDFPEDLLRENIGLFCKTDIENVLDKLDALKRSLSL